MFTRAIGKKAVSSTMVEKICAIAESLGVTVVVEGVETPEQASYIRTLHPDAIRPGLAVPPAGERGPVVTPLSRYVPVAATAPAAGTRRSQSGTASGLRGGEKR